MRILVLTNFYPPYHIGGYELRCREVAVGLRRRGHEVRVLTGRYHAGTATETDPEVDRALHLAWGPPYPPEDLPGLLAAEATDRRTLADLIADFKPDVLDVWGMEFASQPLVAALLASRTPTLLTLEDIWLRDAWSRDALCHVGAIARRLRVAMLGTVAELCCLAESPPAVGRTPVSFVSTALADRYAAAGFSFADARVRLAGIDVSPFRAIEPLPAPPPFVIVSVGQLTSSRGQGDLITAAGLAARDDRCPFPIVVRIVGGGGGAYLSELRQQADRHTSERFRVDFAGELPADRVVEFYAGGHLFVHTSHLPEGLPRVLMEAMAAGLAVVATDTGGQRDILDDGRWGPLLPPGQPEQLKEMILDAMIHFDRWRDRARQAREHALEHYNLQHYVDVHAADLAATAEKKASDPFFAAPQPSADELALFSRSLGAATEQFAAVLNAKTDPHDAWQVAVVLKRTGRLMTAEALLRQLHASHIDEPTHIRRATFHLAEIAMLQGRWPEAIEWLAACLAAAPDHRKAAYDLDHARRHILPDHLTGLKTSETANERR